MNTMSAQRQLERSESQNKLNVLKQHLNKVIFVHYSCESFNKKSLPRVTSIGVKIYESNESSTFSIHHEVEKAGKDPKLLSSQELDMYEKKMLTNFYSFVRKHKTARWVHWSMKSGTYGFIAIANRFKFLLGKPVDIEHEFRYDLYELLTGLYTENFESDSQEGRLLSLAKRNNIHITDTLTGKQEIKVFANGDFQKLTLSVERKVNIICEIFKRAMDDRVLVNSTRFEIHGSYFPDFITRFSLKTVLWGLFLYVAGIVFEEPIRYLKLSLVFDWLHNVLVLITNSTFW